MLSNSEQQLVKEFRERVKDVLKPEHDDFYLVRWLRARKCVIQDAEEMLRKSLDWRKKFDVDNILTNWQPPEVLKKYFPGGVCGFDKEGRPIFLGLSGDHFDIKGISLSVKRTDFIRYCIYQVEYIQSLFQAQSAKIGRRVDKVTLIGDMKTFSMRHLFLPGSDMLPKVLGIVESNYPEMLGNYYVLNAPFIFPMVFNVIKPFLHEETREKIILLGSNWKEKLLEIIDPDQLPTAWGGTQVGPNNDLYCSHKVCLGGTVPNKYFMKGHNLIDPSKVTKVTVAAGSCLKLEVNATSSDQILRWIFWTKHYGISFSVREKSSNVPLVDMPHVNCHEVPEDGFLQIEKSGTYVVQFDNSFSWFHKKHLSYSVELMTSTSDGDAAGAVASVLSTEQVLNEDDDDDDVFEEAEDAIRFEEEKSLQEENSFVNKGAKVKKKHLEKQ